jgi:hypothetical protein
MKRITIITNMRNIKLIIAESKLWSPIHYSGIILFQAPRIALSSQTDEVAGLPDLNDETLLEDGTAG